MFYMNTNIVPISINIPVSYILFIFLLLFIFCFIYLKKKYGFWILQPVFHVYDIGYMFCSPTVIQVSLPEKNKYTNFKNIDTTVYHECTNLQMNSFVSFIRFHYLQNNNNIFSPTLENVEPYFKGHNQKSFITFYKEPMLLWDPKNQTTIPHETIIGTITGRPIQVSFKATDIESFHAYCVDYLCVDKTQRKKGIAPQLIQTHEYNQRHLNKKISVSVFKREEVLTGIVPICVYDTYGFPANKWAKPPEMHGLYTMVEVNAQNIHMLYDFMKRTKDMFEVNMCADMSNIVELIKTNNVFVSILLEDKIIVSAYFYRKTCVFIEKGIEVLCCFASINSTEEASFIQGFKTSFWKTCEKHYLGFLAIESISHNHILIDNLKQKTAPTIISPTAYFFYNFVYPTVSSSAKVFVLN